MAGEHGEAAGEQGVAAVVDKQPGGVAKADEKAPDLSQKFGLTDEQKFAIREYLDSLEGGREALRRTRLQFWLAVVGLSGAGIASGVWFGVTDLVKSTVNSEIERNQYVQNIQTKLNDSIENLISARSKHADAAAIAGVTLKESERVLTESNALLTKIKSTDRDLQDAQPIIAAAKNMSAFSGQIAAQLSASKEFADMVAHSAVVPSGAIVSFGKTADGASPCPPGWSNYRAASGRFLVGAGRPDTSSIASYELLATGGAQSVQLKVSQLPNFRVSIPTFRSSEFTLQNSGYVGYRFIGQAARDASKSAAGALVVEQSEPIGAGEEIDARPPFLAVQYCSKD